MSESKEYNEIIEITHSNKKLPQCIWVESESGTNKAVCVGFGNRVWNDWLDEWVTNIKFTYAIEGNGYSSKKIPDTNKVYQSLRGEIIR